MTKDIYAVLGDRIRDERKRAGLTIEELADRAGISSSFLAYIETNSRKASLATVQRVAEALRLSPGDMLRDAPGAKRDSLYDAAQQFVQLVRDKHPDEISGVIEIVRAAVKRPRHRR